MKRNIAHYSLHAINFFDLTVKKICDVPVSSELVCVCNSVRVDDVVDKIVEREQTIYVDACVAGRMTFKRADMFSSKDIFVSHTNWIRKAYGEMLASSDQPVTNEYEQAFKFINDNIVLATYGVDADESDIYLLVVEYTEIDV